MKAPQEVATPPALAVATMNDYSANINYLFLFLSFILPYYRHLCWSVTIVMIFMKVVEKTPSLAKRNVGAHFVVIATRNSSYVMRSDNVLVLATTLAMCVLK
jgi:hypothetical protein